MMEKWRKDPVTEAMRSQPSRFRESRNAAARSGLMSSRFGDTSIHPENDEVFQCLEKRLDLQIRAALILLSMAKSIMA